MKRTHTTITFHQDGRTFFSLSQNTTSNKLNLLKVWTNIYPHRGKTGERTKGPLPLHPLRIVTVERNQFRRMIWEGLPRMVTPLFWQVTDDNLKGTWFHSSSELPHSYGFDFPRHFCPRCHRHSAGGKTPPLDDDDGSEKKSLPSWERQMEQEDREDSFPKQTASDRRKILSILLCSGESFHFDPSRNRDLWEEGV